MSNARGGVYWVELVACVLTEEGEEHLLSGHLNVIITERKREEQRRKKEMEIRRKMMLEGSEAVDNMLDVTRLDAGGTTTKVEVSVDGGADVEATSDP